MNKKQIEILLSKFSNDEEYFETETLEHELRNLDISPAYFLYVLTDNLYDEKYCEKAIKSLLETGRYDPNTTDSFGYNFIQNALYSGYSSSFIYNIIEASLNAPVGKKLNVNHVDEDSDTIMHTAIYSDDYKDDLLDIYSLLCAHGFDSKIVDKEGRNILEAMESEQKRVNKYADKEFAYMRAAFIKNIVNSGSENEETSKIIDEILSTENEDKIKKVSKILSSLFEGYYKKNAFEIKENLKNTNLCSLKEFPFLLTKYHFDENKCLLGIYSLLKENYINPNDVDEKGNNIIQNALCTGYSEDFIYQLIEDCLTFDSKLNVNHLNINGETIMHSAIYSDNYKGELEYIYNLLCENGFDSRLEDNLHLNLINAISCAEISGSKKYNDEQIKKMTDMFNEEVSSIDNRKLQPRESISPKRTNPTNNAQPKVDVFPEKRNFLTKKEIEELEEFGKVLTSKNYKVEPTIGRENELKNLMITLAQEKKSPIIVGESGVGKTAIVDELAYKIAKDEVPQFLKNKIILEVSPNELVAGCKYVGQFEEKMSKLFKACEKYDLILFIDEIHTMYGVGTTENKSTDMSAMVKHYLDRSELKIIGTTTELEYQEFFASDALKRRFEKIKVNEPTDKFLKDILNKVIEDYCFKSGLNFEDELTKYKIIDVLMRVTEKRYRVYDDRVNNPDLAISIIDKAFAFSKFYDDSNITVQNFIDSLTYCDRIYESARKDAISQLKSKTTKSNSNGVKILEVDFTKFRR